MFANLQTVDTAIQACVRPGMYSLTKTYQSVSGFVMGLESAGQLIGFHEWVIAEYRENAALSWDLILRGHHNRTKDPDTTLSEREESEVLCTILKHALEGYRSCLLRGGYADVFERYFVWLMSSDYPVKMAYRRKLRSTFRRVLRTKQ